MPNKDSRCVNREYCIKVIKGEVFSISNEKIDDPLTDPHLTDYELTSIILEKLRVKGIKKDLGFDPQKNDYPDR